MATFWLLSSTLIIYESIEKRPYIVSPLGMRQSVEKLEATVDNCRKMESEQKQRAMKYALAGKVRLLDTM